MILILVVTGYFVFGTLCGTPESRTVGSMSNTSNTSNTIADCYSGIERRDGCDDLVRQFEAYRKDPTSVLDSSLIELKDGWKRPVRVDWNPACKQGGWRLIVTSGGKDRRFGTDDDIVSRTNWIGNCSNEDFRSQKLMTHQFRGTNLEGADFSYADLNSAEFYSVTAAATFRNAHVIGARFYKSILNGSDFEGANLRYARFADTKLVGVNLRNADLRQPDVYHHTYFDDVDLSQADMSGATIYADGEHPPNKSEWQCFKNVIWNNTICPDGTTPPKNSRIVGSAISAFQTAPPVPTTPQSRSIYIPNTQRALIAYRTPAEKVYKRQACLLDLCFQQATKKAYRYAPITRR